MVTKTCNCVNLPFIFRWVSPRVECIGHIGYRIQLLFYGTKRRSAWVSALRTLSLVINGNLGTTVLL